jgi:micrococcal nuclease
MIKMPKQIVSYEYRAHVNDVVDGDTIDCNIDLGFKVGLHERFRFYGINTPESRTANEEEKKAGLAVKEYVTKQIKWQDVTIVSIKQEKFGRFLAMVYYGPDKVCLNQELVDKGMASEYYGEKRVKYGKDDVYPGGSDGNT